MSPACKHDPAGDGTPLHQRVPFRRLRERQDTADERLDRTGGEEMQRHLHVLERGIAGSGNANAPHDDGAGSSSTGRAPILPSTTTVACCAHDRKLSRKVPVTTFSSTTSAPCLAVTPHTSALNFNSGLMMTSSAPAARTISALACEHVTESTRACTLFAT